jgi:hypothetical protein
MNAADWRLRKLAEIGFVLLEEVYTSAQINQLVIGLQKSFEQQPASAICGAAGGVYAARNVLELFPEAATVWRQAPLPETLTAVLGPEAGLVRGLYFDKPPDQSWGLPWHKDVTIAVRDNRLPSSSFSKPTVKGGVPHVEAPREVLEKMLSVRIHLDEVTDENGPLKVLPGSHRTGKESTAADCPVTILAGRGDVLLMRPLLDHASGHSSPGTRRHRRILHLEFAGVAELTDGYQWFDFRPLSLL